MRAKIIEKLKEKEVSEKVLEAKSGEEVYEIFKSKGMEISKEEAEEILKGKENLAAEISKLSDEDLTLSGGYYMYGPFSDLADIFRDYTTNKYKDAEANSASKKFWDVVSDYSEPMLEGAVGLALVGTTVAATLGIPKIYNYCKNKFKKNK